MSDSQDWGLWLGGSGGGGGGGVRGCGCGRKEGGDFQCKMIEWLNIVAGGKQTQRSSLSQRRKQAIVLTSVFKKTRR